MSVIILVALMVLAAVILAITWIEPKVLGGPAAAKGQERASDPPKPRSEPAELRQPQGRSAR